MRLVQMDDGLQRSRLAVYGTEAWVVLVEEKLNLCSVRDIRPFLPHRLFNDPRNPFLDGRIFGRYDDPKKRVKLRVKPDMDHT